MYKYIYIRIYIYIPTHSCLHIADMYGSLFDMENVFTKDIVLFSHQTHRYINTQIRAPIGVRAHLYKDTLVHQQDSFLDTLLPPPQILAVLYIHIRKDKHTDIYTHAHTHAYTPIHTHTHAHTHTNAHAHAHKDCFFLSHPQQ